MEFSKFNQPQSTHLSTSHGLRPGSIHHLRHHSGPTAGQHHLQRCALRKPSASICRDHVHINHNNYQEITKGAFENILRDHTSYYRNVWNRGYCTLDQSKSMTIFVLKPWWLRDFGGTLQARGQRLGAMQCKLPAIHFVHLGAKHVTVSLAKGGVSMV